MKYVYIIGGIALAAWVVTLVIRRQKMQQMREAAAADNTIEYGALFGTLPTDNSYTGQAIQPVDSPTQVSGSGAYTFGNNPVYALN